MWGVIYNNTALQFIGNRETRKNMVEYGAKGFSLSPERMPWIIYMHV